jgi:hypothetical protein
MSIENLLCPCIHFTAEGTDVLMNVRETICCFASDLFCFCIVNTGV